MKSQISGTFEVWTRRVLMCIGEMNMITMGTTLSWQTTSNIQNTHGPQFFLQHLLPHNPN